MGLELELLNAEQRGDVISVLKLIPGFLRRYKPVLVNGGVAMNLMLPSSKKIYSADSLYDYDLLSSDPALFCFDFVEYARARGFAKTRSSGTGVVFWFFRVRVHDVPIIDINGLPKDFFDRLWRERKVVAGLNCVPPTFIKMTMYLILSDNHNSYQDRQAKTAERLRILTEAFPALESPEVSAPAASAVPETLVEVIRSSGCVVLSANIHARRGKTPELSFPLHLLSDDAVEFSRNVLKPLLSDLHGRIESFFTEPYVVFKDDAGSVQVVVYQTYQCHSYHQSTTGLRFAAIPTLSFFYFVSLMCGQPINGIIGDEIVGRRWRHYAPLTCLGLPLTLEHRLTVHKKRHSELVANGTLNKDFLREFFFYPEGKFPPERRAAILRSLKRVPPVYSKSAAL